MYAVLSPAADGWSVLRCDARARPLGEPLVTADLPATVRELEARDRPRWVFAADAYPRLLRARVRVHRCHDLALTESILLAFEGRYGEPGSLAAAWARLAGLALPEEPDRTGYRVDNQPALFDPASAPLPGGASPERAARAVLADQLDRIAATPWAGRLRLLVAAESVGALAAAEMRHAGLPWDAPAHSALLTELLGPRPAAGTSPPELARLSAEITEAFGGRPVNPEHPDSVQRALHRDGVTVPSTRATVLRTVKHPAVAPLLRYKELSRLHAAHGWAWLDEWVRDGRFRAEYVVGGVVSGRWATRGGAGLQLPRLLRGCVRAEPGWRLVVADAAQLEPRVLAALSADPRLAEVAAAGDLYAGLAADSFSGRRHDAKVAMLSAMYGGTAGSAAALLGVLRRRFPDAIGYVERAARCGEAGRAVRSVLGRTSPPPSAAGREPDGTGSEPARAARDWGRFTRNFVVQSSAADWALTVLATLRGALLDEIPDAELVLFLHDEIVVHCPAERAQRCAELVARAADQASTLLFGDTAVHFPLPAAVVDCYADAK